MRSTLLGIWGWGCTGPGPEDGTTGESGTTGDTGTVAFSFVLDAAPAGQEPLHFETDAGSIIVDVDDQGRLDGLGASNVDLSGATTTGTGFIAAIDWAFVFGVYRDAPRFETGGVVTSTFDPLLATRDIGSFAGVEHGEGERVELLAVDPGLVSLSFSFPLIAISPSLCLGDALPCTDWTAATGTASGTLSGPYALGSL
jgi:hypothetical protein